MYYKHNLNGANLPAKTICLTFDDGPGRTSGDGPGPRTLELAAYLNLQNIAATFFVVGKYAVLYPDILQALKAFGHLIGNHSFDHQNLFEYFNAGGDVEGQITRNDVVIRKWIDGPTTYVRAPYGSWSPDIADLLNKNLLASIGHVGPINWDIDAGDWESWANGRSAFDAANDYLNQIEARGHGVILNHDCTADSDTTKDKNQTYELMQILIPQLKARGYNFVRLDQVREIALASHVATMFALQASNGLFVSPQNGGGGDILLNGPRVGPWEEITAVDLGYGKVALQVPNGNYISPQDGGGREVLANGPAVGPWEKLDLIQLQNGRVAFRTITGHYITRENAESGRLMANVTHMLDWEIFNYVPIGV